MSSWQIQLQIIFKRNLFLSPEPSTLATPSSMLLRTRTKPATKYLKKKKEKFHFCQQLLTTSPSSVASMQSVTKSWQGLRIQLGAGHVMRMNVTCRNIRQQHSEATSSNRNENIENMPQTCQKKEEENQAKSARGGKQWMKKQNWSLRFFFIFCFCP